MRVPRARGQHLAPLPIARGQGGLVARTGTGAPFSWAQRWGREGACPSPPQQARASPWQCPDTFGVKAGPGRGKGKQTWWLRLALSQVCPVATGSGRARAQEEGVLQGDGPGAGAAQAMWLPLVFPAWPGPQLLIPVPIHPGPLCLPPGPAPQSCPSLSVPTPVLASSHPWGRLGLRLASGFFQLL